MEFSDATKKFKELILTNKLDAGLPGKFSWEDFTIEGNNLLPEPLDQLDSQLCVVFSLQHLLMFQKNIISITEKNVPHVSLNYLKSIVGDIRNVEDFVSKLRSCHIMDEDEFSKGGNILRFSIDSVTIDAEEEDNVVDLTKQAVSDFGGAILTVYLYAVNREGKFRVNKKGNRVRVLVRLKDMYPENNPRHTDVSSDSPSPSDSSDSDFNPKKNLSKVKKRKKLNKRKKPEKTEEDAKEHLSHALFAHGWVTSADGAMKLRVMDSDPSFRPPNGFEEVEYFDDIILIHAIQLKYDAGGIDVPGAQDGEEGHELTGGRKDELGAAVPKHSEGSDVLGARNVETESLKDEEEGHELTGARKDEVAAAVAKHSEGSVGSTSASGV